MIIDNGNYFDFGRTSADYAKYRDIYPPIFYEKILNLGLCKKGQTVLDIGTGTGVLPRNMYLHGAKWEQEYIALLGKIAPSSFEVLHYAAILELKKR